MIIIFLIVPASSIGMVICKMLCCISLWSCLFYYWISNASYFKRIWKSNTVESSLEQQQKLLEIGMIKRELENYLDPDSSDLVYSYVQRIWF